MFYRENQSVKSVAESLEISEDAVKQRLSRGRVMLKDQVSSFVENTLLKSKPSDTFAIAVIAALPALTPQIAASTIALAAAKGSTAFKSAVSFLFIGSVSSVPLGYIGGVFGGLVGILGGIIGAIISLRSAKSSRERQFLTKSMGITLVWILIFYIVLFSAIHFFLHDTKLLILIFGITAIHLTGFTVLIIWMNRRIKQIQVEEGTYIAPSTWEKQAYQNFGKLSKGQIYGGYAGSIFGSICWMLVVSIMANDWFTAIIIILASCLVYLVSTYNCIRNPIRYYKIAIWICFYVYLLTVGAILFRWETWRDFLYIDTYFKHYHPNRIEIILGLLVLYILFVLFFHHLDKKIANLELNKTEMNLH